MYKRQVQLILACPPCPPFTPSSIHMGRDERAELVTRTVDVFLRSGAQSMVMENVKGMRRAAVWQVAKRRLQAAGFEVGEAVLKAEKLGVPQLRWRLIIIITKAEGRLEWEREWRRRSCLGRQTRS